MNAIKYYLVKNFYGLFLLLACIFYLSSIHVYVTNYNDFGEYFSRSEAMLRDFTAYWVYGSDKLLSLLELVPIYIFNNDFIKIYYLIASLLIIILFISLYVFVTSEAPYLPSKKIERLIAVIVLLFTPTFFYAATSVEQNILAASMLLLFISLAHRPFWGGLFAFLCTLARPEALILFVFYPVLVVYLKKTDRFRGGVYGFVLFVFLFILYKAIALHYGAPISSDEALFSNSNIGFDIIVLSVVRAFIFIFWVPLEIFKSYFLAAIFFAGIIYSLYFYKEKQLLWVMFFVLYVAAEAFVWTLIRSDMHLLISDFQTVKEMTRLFPYTGTAKSLVMGHSVVSVRYNLFIFPLMALIFVYGIKSVFSAANMLFSKQQLVRNIAVCIPLSLFVFSCFASVYAFKTNPIFSRQDFGKPDFFGVTKDKAEIAIALRKLRDGEMLNTLLLDSGGICDDSSALAIFGTIVGAPIYCQASGVHWTSNKAGAYKLESLNFSERAIGVFKPFLMDWKASFGEGRHDVLEQVFALDYSAIREENILYIVSSEMLQYQFLEYQQSASEKYYIYKVVDLK